jgi:hypothetical protein
LGGGGPGDNGTEDLSREGVKDVALWLLLGVLLGLAAAMHWED